MAAHLVRGTTGGVKMNSEIKRLAAAAAMVVSLSAPAFAQATMSIENRGDRSSSRWESRQERLNAQPLDWDATRGTPGAATAPEPRARQVPGQAAGGLPTPGSHRQAREAYPNEWPDEPENGGTDFGTADTFTQYCENCGAVNSNYPQIAIGKLFSNSGTCSASVISGQNVIVTAAHCCYNRSTKSWIRGWSFSPAHRDGFSPFGVFPWTSARILTRWVNVGDRRSDICVIKLGNNSSGFPVTYYTGWLGRSWDWSTKQVHHAVGYPGNIGGAEKKELCVSESFNPNSSCGGGTVLNTGCSMTYGSSGGPWIRHYRTGNWVNSVVSGYDSTTCTGTFGQTFNGPRFTSQNIVPLCDKIGC
jgi:V8-like Glu-specific endopeptidase